MKKILFILFVLSVSSCKKQFTCDNGDVITKGDYRFESAKRGEVITDASGKEIHCF